MLLPRPPIMSRVLACGLTAVAGVLATWLLLLTARSARPAEAVVLDVVYPGCAPTIQQCIDAAAPGQTIVIQAGTYITSLTLDKAVSLTGVSSAQVTLQALPNQRVLTVTGSAVSQSIVVSGLTLAGGHALGGACPAACGGGIAVVSAAQPSIENVVLTNNLADHFGGGLYADTDSHVSLLDVQVISNSAAVAGGGAFLYPAARITGGEFRENHTPGFGGGLEADFILTLTGTRFYTNVAGTDGGGLYANGVASLTGAWFQGNHGQRGGGLFSMQPGTLASSEFHDNQANEGGGAYALGSLTLNDGIFQGNHGSLNGGGLFAGSTVVIAGTRFLSNTAAVAGGGAYALSSATLDSGDFQGNRCTGTGCVGGGLSAAAVAAIYGGHFSGNHCDAPGCRGGGLFAGAGLTVNSTEFRNNRAAQGGGLWHLAGAGLVANTLFAGNSVSETGAALYLNSTGPVAIVETTIASPILGAHAAINVAAGTVTITDTIIAHYSVGLSRTAGSVSEDYNLFDANGTNIVGSVASGTHHPTGDPKFADVNGGNYHLSAGSPAIDAGTNAGQAFDFEANSRPIGAGFDIGYDEFGIVLRLPLVFR